MKKPLSILLADDEEGIRRLVEQWLLRAGHTVTLAADGREATKALRERSFDVLITDIVMPDGDGLELIASFKKAQPAARILAMALTIYVCYRFAQSTIVFLGKAGTNVMVRLSAFILLCIGFQIMWTGYSALVATLH